MTDTTQKTAVDSAVAAAKDLPDLIAKASAVDPALAASLQGKSLVASKTPWGTLAVALVTYGSAKYGLGWDESTCTLIGGAGVLVGAYLMRYVSPARITGLFSKS